MTLCHWKVLVVFVLSAFKFAQVDMYRQRLRERLRRKRTAREYGIIQSATSTGLKKAQADKKKQSRDERFEKRCQCCDCGSFKALVSTRFLHHAVACDNFTESWRRRWRCLLSSSQWENRNCSSTVYRVSTALWWPLSSPALPTWLGGFGCFA